MCCPFLSGYCPPCTYDRQANDLVAENFYNASDNLLLDAVNFNSYRVRSAGQTLGLHMGPSRSHATILALLNGPGQQQHSAGAEVGCCCQQRLGQVLTSLWCGKCFDRSLLNSSCSCSRQQPLADEILKWAGMSSEHL
jgi:hypothetical protein